MTIRSATLQDIKDIATIHVIAWQVVYKGLIPQSYLDNLSIAKREQNWSSILNNSKNQTIVQEINGRVVGFANFGNTRDKDKNYNVTGEITSIYLDPEHWRKGLGAELFQFILSEMKNKEFTEVTLWVLDTNQTACSFYQKMGFKPDGATKIDIREDFKLKEIRYSINVI